MHENRNQRKSIFNIKHTCTLNPKAVLGGDTCVKALHAHPLPSASLERRHKDAEQTQAGQEEAQDCTQGKAGEATAPPNSY